MIDAAYNVSVIVPCYNAASTIGECIDALIGQTVTPFEIIVADDASTDESASIASERETVKVVSLPFNGGAAAARNAGAGRAGGDILLFVDADVALEPDALEKLAATFSLDDAPDAVVGMYSVEAGRDDFYSVAHNYFTYYNHSRQQGRVKWFWGAIGAVKVDAFRSVGGFDYHRYSGASAEDIELGFRLSRAGYDIIMDNGVVGKHMVKFDLYRYLHNDFRKSALGANLFLSENRRLENEHGFASSSNGAAVATAGMAAFCAAMWALGIFPVWTIALMITLFYISAAPYLSFVYSHKGTAFALKAALLHIVSFAGIAAGAALGTAQFMAARE